LGLAIARQPWGAIASITDDDDRGLDHSATFTYDTRGRLTAAVQGGGKTAYTFGFAYDDLQNMTSRTVDGPRRLGVFDGTYTYGGAGPHQLTAIAGAKASHTFGYDAAGRQIAADTTAMSFNALDQLRSVTLASGTVEHRYGYDGSRLVTTAAGGDKRWFDPDIAEVGETREYLVRVDDRVLARVVAAAPGSAASKVTAGIAPVQFRALWQLAIGLAL